MNYYMLSRNKVPVAPTALALSSPKANLGLKDEVTNVLRLANLVRENVHTKQLFTPCNPILFTLSGGQDSICSLLLVFLLQNQLGLEFNAQTKSALSSLGATRAQDIRFCARVAPREFGLLWCNHFWQKESFHTMLHVAKINLCFSSAMCFYVPIEQVLCEQNAREWRHKSIQRTCAFFHYDCCAQGHTKSDRVETIFFNILRGTGIAGLQALQWKKSFYSFSCQRFFPWVALALAKPLRGLAGAQPPKCCRKATPCLSYCKDNWVQSTAPPLNLTQNLYKIKELSKFYLVNIRAEPTFRLRTKYSYRLKVGYQQPRQLRLSIVSSTTFARQPKTPLDKSREALTKPKALKVYRTLTRAKREFAKPEKKFVNSLFRFCLGGAPKQPVCQPTFGWPEGPREQTPKGLTYELYGGSVEQILFVRESDRQRGQLTLWPIENQLAHRSLEHYWLLRSLLIKRMPERSTG